MTVAPMGGTFLESVSRWRDMMSLEQLSVESLGEENSAL